MLLYLGALCNGILEALAEVERAAFEALACQTPRCLFNQPQAAQLPL